MQVELTIKMTLEVDSKAQAKQIIRFLNEVLPEDMSALMEADPDSWANVRVIKVVTK